jgi:hypothetical protein
MVFIIRITISVKELKVLQELCREHGQAELYKKLHIEEEKYEKSITEKKTNATKKATKTRQDIAKKKIEASVNMMRMFNQKITIYSVAKEAQVSYNTASKYKDYIIQNSK